MNLRRQRARTLLNATKDHQKDIDKAANEKAMKAKAEARGSFINVTKTIVKPFKEYLRVKDMESVRKLEKELGGGHQKSWGLIGVEGNVNISRLIIIHTTTTDDLYPWLTNGATPNSS